MSYHIRTKAVSKNGFVQLLRKPFYTFTGDITSWQHTIWYNTSYSHYLPSSSLSRSLWWRWHCSMASMKLKCFASDYPS